MSSKIAIPPARNRRLLSSFLSLVLLAGFASSMVWAAAAPEPAGRVIRTLGVVEAVAADGTVRRLRRSDPIYEGDTLRTGARGRGQIRFTDRGLLSLRPETEIAIDDYAFTAAAPAAGRQQLSLRRGGFRTMTGRVASGNRSAYSVRTPLAVIGVRGTIYDSYLAANGSLLLGVSDGTIEATTLAGRLARLGVEGDFNFARVNPDGTVEFLIEPPGDLSASPDLDEGGDEEGDGDGGDEEGGGELGETEESTVAEGGGDAESTAGTPDASVSAVATTSDPNQTSAINQAETGDGNLPTTEPIPLAAGAVFSAADREAILASTDVVILAGGEVDAVDANGEPIFEPGIGVAVGIGALDADGEPLLASAVDLDGVGEVFRTSTREELLDLADAFLIPESAPPGPTIFDGARTFLPAGGDAGVTWGSFAQPATIFLDPLNRNVSVDTIGDNDLLFALGTPSDIAELTGTASFQFVDSRVSSTGGFIVTRQESDAFVNFGTGFIEGIVDVVLSDQGDLETELFAYIVDFSGAFQDGLLTDLALLPGSSLLDFANEVDLPVDGEITGFFSGTGAEYLNLAFAYQTPGRSDLNVQGLVLLQQGLTPPNALTAQELGDLSQGFGYAQAVCCDGRATFAGRIVDPRLSLGVDTVISGGGLSPFDPLFDAIPQNNIILRRDGATVVNYADGFDFGAGAEISTFEWQGFNAGGPIGIYNAETGELISSVFGNALFLAGRIADIADLTGTGRYRSTQLAQGFFNGVSGDFPAQPIVGADIVFNVDFNTAQIDNGLARLFTDVDQPGDVVDAAFEGQIAVSNGNPFALLTVTEGFAVDIDGDTGGSGIVDPLQSSMSGFFAGDGSVFNLAFDIVTAADPDAPMDFIEPLTLVGLSVLERQNLALTADEAVELGLGRVFTAVECCDLEGGIAGGPAGDPMGANGDFVLGLNIDAMLGEDLLPSDPGFLSSEVEGVVRLGSASAFVDMPMDVPPELGLVAGVWEERIGAGAIVVDAITGDLESQLGRFVFFNTAFPSTVADLQAEGGLRTFAGASNIAAPFVEIQTLGGFAASNLTDLDPAFQFAPGAAVSFNFDLATGLVTNGMLFGLTEVDTLGTFPEEFGFRVFFDGQIAYANGNTFLEANIIDGVFNERTPIDTSVSELILYIAGDGPAGDSSFLAQGAYFLQSQNDPAFGSPIVLGGTFGIGSDLLPENRLTELDAVALNTGRFGIAAFNDIALGAVPLEDELTGTGGLLLGRANAPMGNDFLLGANYYDRKQSTDPVTRVPLFDMMTGLPLLEEANTARRGFFLQPYDFLVRQGTATEFLFDADVVPTGGMSLPGFEIGWGLWDGGSTTGALVQADPTDAMGGITVTERDVIFASVNPTPQSQMPVVGTFSYSTAPGAVFGVDFLGVGVGDLTDPFTEFDATTLAMSFDVDFSNADILNGVVEVRYDGFSGNAAEWSGAFDGFVNGAVADLRLTALDVTEIVGGVPGGTFAGDLNMSSITGVFTGPSAERFVGGFNFFSDLGGTGVDAATGIAILDAIDPLR